MQKHQLVNLLSVLEDTAEIKATFHTDRSFPIDHTCAISGIGIAINDGKFETTVKFIPLDSDDNSTVPHVTKETLLKVLSQINDECDLKAIIEFTYSKTIGSLNGFDIKFDSASGIYAVLCASELTESDDKQELAA